MTISKAMASPMTISDLASDSVGGVKSKRDLVLGSTCYDAGMAEVLKGVAKTVLSEKVFVTSKQSLESIKRFDEAREAIFNTLSGEHLKLLVEFEEAYAELAGIEACDWFVEGFIEGYRYLKYSIAHKGD
jgi:hypothetical protein